MDNLMISVGKKMNTISGLTGAITNAVFRYLNNDATAIDAAITGQQWGIVG